MEQCFCLLVQIYSPKKSPKFLQFQHNKANDIRFSDISVFAKFLQQKKYVSTHDLSVIREKSWVSNWDLKKKNNQHAVI